MSEREREGDREKRKRVRNKKGRKKVRESREREIKKRELLTQRENGKKEREGELVDVTS